MTVDSKGRKRPHDPPPHTTVYVNEPRPGRPAMGGLRGGPGPSSRADSARRILGLLWAKGERASGASVELSEAEGKDPL
jgi:hypothetical protein